jgi:hypothetical protein
MLSVCEQSPPTVWERSGLEGFSARCICGPCVGAMAAVLRLAARIYAHCKHQYSKCVMISGGVVVHVRTCFKGVQ